jgi:hypothetical protein
MFAAVRDHAKKDGHAEVMDSLVQAVGFETYTDDLAAWAQAAITGKGYSWISPGSTGPERDWGIYLDRWSPQELTGTQWNRAVGNGGITAREIKTGGYVSKNSLATSSLYVIRDDGTTATRTLVNTDDAEADFVPAPAAGERVWLIAVKPGLGTTNVVVKLTAQP